MMKYARLVAIYVTIAVATVLLYAPWFVGLSPASPSILNAWLSIICGLLLGGAFVGSTVLTFRAPEYHLLDSGEVDDVDDVSPMLGSLRDLPVVGSYASDALAQIESMERKCGRLRRAISDKFSEGSLSWDKFVAVVESAQRTIIKNSALLANKVQAFDVDGYRATRRQLTAGGQAAEPDAIVLEHARLYEDAENDMREIIAANDRILFEMNKLEMELSNIEEGGNRRDNERMVDEIQELIEQTKFYA